MVDVVEYLVVFKSRGRVEGSLSAYSSGGRASLPLRAVYHNPKQRLYL